MTIHEREKLYVCDQCGAEHEGYPEGWYHLSRYPKADLLGLFMESVGQDFCGPLCLSLHVDAMVVA